MANFNNFNGYTNPYANDPRFTGRNQSTPEYPGFNNFHRPAMELPGRIVSQVEEITPQEVPMDGSVGLFPQNDYSCIYAKQWTKDGNIQTVRYVPEQPAVQTDQKTPLEEHLDRIEEKLEALDKKLNRQKNYQKRPYPKKKEGENNV